MYEASGPGSAAYDVNTFNVGATYSRRVFSWATLLVSLNYANVSGDEISRDLVYFRTTLQGGSTS